MTPRVFITDGHWRKSLAAVRGLGKEGVGVTVGETTRIATAAFSRYATKVEVYPSPTKSPDSFLQFLMDRLSKNRYQMLLPMEDTTVDIAARHFSELSQHTYLPLVSLERLKLAQRKDKVVQLAEKLGIPVPKTWFISNLSQLDKIKAELSYPVVIKPTTGSGAVGVSYPADPVEFKKLYLNTHRLYPYPIIQEMIPREGNGYGASFLFDEQAHVKASFVHKRLREYPVSGGASTFRESVRRDDIRDMGRKILKALDWFGVAMVEFKVDPRDGTPKLLEINPRFWGSLALAVRAGVNFPYLLYRMSKGENFNAVESYETGIKCRWLLPGDMLHFISNPRRRDIRKSFFDFRDKGTVYDILSKEDPLPAIGRILTPLTFLYDPDMKMRLKGRRASQNITR
ncbi:ATP-grasp domain-containing protein [Thermodesulfobacteriota bacterium]